MRILITGPESSGKSSLAFELSNYLKIPLIAEYAREYLELRSGEYEQDDLVSIGKGHLEKLKELEDPTKVICDTYLLNLKIWSEYKFFSCNKWIIDNLKNTSFDKVLLLKPNINWVPDPLRENPENRDEIFEIFKKEVEKLQWPYEIIDNKGPERFNQALSYIQS